MQQCTGRVFPSQGRGPKTFNMTPTCWIGRSLQTLCGDLSGADLGGHYRDSSSGSYTRRARPRRGLRSFGGAGHKRCMSVHMTWRRGVGVPGSPWRQAYTNMCMRTCTWLATRSVQDKRPCTLQITTLEEPSLKPQHKRKSISRVNIRLSFPHRRSSSESHVQDKLEACLSCANVQLSKDLRDCEEASKAHPGR